MKTEGSRWNQWLNLLNKIATSRLIKNKKGEDDGTNDELLQAINVFSERLHRTQEPELNAGSSRNSGANPVLVHHTLPMEEERRNLSLEHEPTHRIIKKRYKQTRSKKKTKNGRLLYNGSPITKEQLKLLHDPKSLEKYANEMDLEQVRFAISDSKKQKK